MYLSTGAILPLRELLEKIESVPYNEVLVRARRCLVCCRPLQCYCTIGANHISLLHLRKVIQLEADLAEWRRHLLSYNVLQSLCVALHPSGCTPSNVLEMCAGQNLQERERKEMRSHLKKIFLVPVFFRFFSFLERVFPLFPIFLRISHPVLRRSFPVFSSFHLSKPVLGFLMGLKLAILERVLNENLSKPVPRRSSNRSSPFLKSFLVFPQPIFLSNKEKREPGTALVLKGYTLASV